MPNRFIPALIAGLTIAGSAMAAPGGLDATFGSGGKTSFTLSNCDARSLALQSDGKILIAGSSFVSSNDFTIVRFLANGSPDTNFGTSGKVVTDFSGNSDGINKVIVQADGTILVAGTATTNAGQDFALARYLSNGTLDPSFDPIGQDGKVSTDFGTGNDDIGSAMAVQSDGKILVAGYVLDGTSANFGLVRYNANGSRDTNFGTDGRVTTDFNGSSDVVTSIAVQSDGKIVLGGYAFVTAGKGFDFALARYNSDGTPDSSFGVAGKINLDLANGNFDYLQALTVLSSGKILAVGSSASHYAVARFKSNGELDSTFGNGGVTITDFGDPNENLYSLLVLPSGKFLAGGSGDKSFALLCYRANGSLDTSFGTNGRSLVRFATDASKFDTCRGLALTAQKRVIAGGTGSTTIDYVAARLEAPYGLPTLSVTGKSRRLTTRPRIVLRGATTGNVSSVKYKLGRKSRSASGTTKWKISVRLKPGRNVITITAMSPDGNTKPRRITITRS